MSKRRLDSLLAERGLFETPLARGRGGDGGGRPRGRAPGPQAGRDGRRRRRRSRWPRRPPFVSRGGVKLANALDAFGVDPAGRRALDVGASTGGFTDCLLQRGAEAVVALDVAYGELHWTLRQDPRVTVIERRNARRWSRASCPSRPT